MCISALALISNLAEICSEQTAYHCNIAQSCFEHLPRGGEDGLTRALHLKQDWYESNCRMATISAFEIAVSTLSLLSSERFMLPMSEISSIFEPSFAIDKNLVDAYSLTMKL